MNKEVLAHLAHIETSYKIQTKILIQALREAAYNLKQAADGAIDYSRKRDDPCYQETYFREKAAAIRELIKEYEI